MSSSLRFGVGFVLFTVLVAGALVGKAAAATYVVGDSLGWRVPAGPDGDPAIAYTTWASSHDFKVGDILVFDFSTGMHDVARVTKAAYDGCISSTNPIALETVGPASFTLNSTGDQYYICRFGQHCPLGQKLAINVTAAAPAPEPASDHDHQSRFPAPNNGLISPPPNSASTVAAAAISSAPFLIIFAFIGTFFI